MFRQTKRLNSPYTSIQEFNKTAAKEDAYPISESPDLFTWKLNFQQLNKMEIPKPFMERHKITHSHQQSDVEVKNETKKVVHSKQKYDSFFAKSKLPFIDMNQKKSFKMSKFKEFLLRNEQTVYSNKNHSLIKMMSSIPLDKLKEIYEDKKDGVNQMITQSNQLKNQNPKQFIQPKKNNSLTRPLGEFLALVSATCQPSKRKSVKEEKIKSQISAFSIKASVKDDTEPQQLIEISDNSSFKQQPKNDQPFRIKRPSELKHISRNEGMSEFIYQPNNDNIPIHPSSLTARLSQKFGDVGKVLKTESMDEKKYFFNYNNYFRKNYGFSDQGLNSRLSKQTSQTIQVFEQNLQNAIKQKN